MRRFISVFAVAFLLSACSGLATNTDVEKLNEAKPVGSAFTKRLAANYRFYVAEKRKWLDYADAKHSARKGLMAAEGSNVMPEPLSNWHLDDASARQLRDARTELLGALNAGGRAQAPFEAAEAQFAFDCWTEQREQRWISNKPVACQVRFQKAMADLKSRMVKSRPASENVGKPVPEKQKPQPDPNAVEASMDEGVFLVFFDWDRSLLNETGNQIANQIATQAKSRQDLNRITVTGHADTSGGDLYNQRLSQRRAEAVKAALILKGVDAALIQAVGREEKDPMVATPNNTREPANRRAEIRFE